MHALLYATLGPLVEGRYYPNNFPQEDTAPTWPAIRGTLVTAQAFTALCGDDDGESDTPEIQLDVVAIDYDQAAALAAAVRSALVGTDPPSERTGQFETFDRDTKTHRVVLSYRFHPSSSA